MRLFYSPASPYVRKVMIVAHELGIADRIEKLPIAANPVARDRSVRVHNPLGQVPTFITHEGMVIYDSRVICEYLNTQAGGPFFGEGAIRWRNLTDAALGDGLLNAASLAHYEAALRPGALRWRKWIEGHFGKISDAIGRVEMLNLGSRLDIGTITLACAIGYMDFQFSYCNWRDSHPRTARWFRMFSERPSMRETMLQSADGDSSMDLAAFT